MIDVTLSIFALIAVGFTMELFAASGKLADAAEEYDFRGAVRDRQLVAEFECGNPS